MPSSPSTGPLDQLKLASPSTRPLVQIMLACPSTPGPLARLKSASPSTFEPLSRLKSTRPFTIENRSSPGLSSGGLPAQTTDTSTASRDVQSLQHRFEKTTVARQRLEKLQLKFAATEFNKALRTHNLSPPKPMDNFTINSGVTKYPIDRNRQSVFSEYIRRSDCQLPEFVRLLRGESVSDSRPNKALHVPRV
uniref:Uncharacterized protein n=1 Tax=Phytophthora fragariae TaxID=53985 RepID=A0A6A3E5N1_9STRA|nr:hypothetical protein PF009_g24639 [Phytophthora fragariae]